jgi:hypothetical protein
MKTFPTTGILPKERIFMYGYGIKILQKNAVLIWIHMLFK